ncbi:phosphoribosylglycinamide formyltransferase [Candidatus Kaiserbacteria bacterium]|nr:phosphoribosylglycinamide formyltransferase [Candidatus Kaiserbacteria bacterium]
MRGQFPGVRYVTSRESCIVVCDAIRSVPVLMEKYMKRESIGVLVSGAGSNLSAMIEAGLSIAVVVADRECDARWVAMEADIPFRVVRWEEYKDARDMSAARNLFTQQIVREMRRHEVTLVAMAGFMRILSWHMFEAYPQRVLNVHPSLLPLFPGAHAVCDALAAGALETGCTVHIATEKVDDDQYILAQQRLPVFPHDTEASLHTRIKAIEHRIYPTAIKEYMDQLKNRVPI